MIFLFLSPYKVRKRKAINQNQLMHTKENGGQLLPLPCKVKKKSIRVPDTQKTPSLSGPEGTFHENNNKTLPLINIFSTTPGHPFRGFPQRTGTFQRVQSLTRHTHVRKTPPLLSVKSSEHLWVYMLLLSPCF